MSIAPVTARPPAPVPPRAPESPGVVGPMGYDEYAEFDRAALRKHQLIEGIVVEMPGGSPEHALIMGDVYRALDTAVEQAGSACIAFPPDMGIYLSSTRSFYADAIVAGAPPQYDLNLRLRNPVVIVEVLSPSTEVFDRDKKFKAYQGLPSLRHYLLVSQHDIFVTHYVKNTDGKWQIEGMYTDLTDVVTLTLDDATITIAVSRIYRRVTFEPADDTDAAQTGDAAG